MEMLTAETETNRVQLTGRIDDIRQRWTPDGHQAVIAALIIPRPKLGPARASIEAEQPMPLRATGKHAEALLAHQHKTVNIEGILRRRYYSRDGDIHWGQVEVWVEQCTPIQENEHD